MRTSSRVLVALFTAFHFAGCASNARRMSNPEESGSAIVPLALTHDVTQHLQIGRGESVTLHATLTNVSDHAISISHGSRMFVLDAILSIPQGRGTTGDLTIPPNRSWGRVQRWEFPNPNAAYSMGLARKTMRPGESNRVEYRVPFDSAGNYSIRVCADVNDTRICGPRDIAVAVR
jgi:hypothetical protein